MSFRDWLVRTLSTKDSQARVLLTQLQTGPYVPVPKDYKSFSEEGYQKNAVAYRAVSLIAGSTANINWLLYRKSKSKQSKLQEIEDHPLLKLIRRPNPFQAQSAFMQAVVSYKLISGNSYIEAVGETKSKLTQPTELWPLRPDRMKIAQGPRGYPLAYIYAAGSNEIRFPVDQVELKSPILHLKFFHPTNDWYGLSPIEAAAMGIDQHNAACKWNSALLQNSARPSGALVCQVTEGGTGSLTDDQFERLKSQIENEYTGASNAGKPMLLEGGLDWKQFSFSPQQMEWIESKDTSARDIASVFGLPPMLLGIPGDNTYSNYQEARASLYEDTVLPLHDSIRDEFNNWLTPLFGDDLVLDSDRDEIAGLAPKRQAVWDKVNQATWLTLNEKRLASGYEEIPGGDVILVQSSQVPLDELLSGAGSTDLPTNNPSNDPTQTDPQNPDNTPVDPVAEDPIEELSDPSDYSPSKVKAAKLFNLRSKADKQKEIRGQLRLRTVLTRKLSRQLRTLFELESNRIELAVKNIDAAQAERIIEREIDANKSSWQVLLKKSLTETSKAFKQRVFNNSKYFTIASETKDQESQFDSWIREWIDTHTGNRIEGIADNTRQQVLDAIRKAQQEAYSEGQTLNDFAAAVEQAYAGFSSARAVTIARTEIGTTANTTLVRAAKATGISNLQKEWVATNDDRTRDDHVEVNGQIVDVDSDFDVGGIKMHEPGDPAAPAKEIVNCRCGVVFLKGAEDTQEEDPATLGDYT